ncbi:MAG: transposase [Patescibacteria group bacterium]
MTVKPTFTTNALYHLYNRGVEKRPIFLDDGDHFRFIHGLYEFNDTATASNLFYKKDALRSYEVKLRKRELLVEILAFCLMSNHFHLFVRQRRELGITQFMHKLGTGYTNYFNKKYERVGGLFQGTFRAKYIESDRHFLYLPHYIHLNPLDFIAPEWREKRIRNKNQALRFLDNYRWSSYRDHTGRENFPFVIAGNAFRELYTTPQKYRQSLEQWIAELHKNIRDMGEIIID